VNPSSNMAVIKRAERFLGVKFWASYRDWGPPPLYLVFKYVGFDADTGLHYFQSLRSPKNVISLNHYQLERGYMRPFCIDDALMREAIGSKES
jgi:hypothetical protein